MTDLTKVVHELVGLFARLQVPYAIMGGIAVRAHGLPRPTFDVDFVVAMPRDLLDIKDILFVQGQLDEAYMRRWAGPLGMAQQLEQAVAERA